MTGDVVASIRLASPAGSQWILESDALRFSYGALEALRGVSIRVGTASAVGVVGVNGAGKSTLSKVITGFLKPTSGTYKFMGEQISGRGSREHMRRGVVLVAEGRKIVARLSVMDNLLIGASCFGMRRPSSEALEFAIDMFPELIEHMGRPVGLLSGGQQQMVAIARALVSKPKVLVLDEPSQGLAPLLQERLARSFRDLIAAGVTLIVVEQNLSFAQQCTDTLYAVSSGEIGFCGNWSEFLAHGGLIEA
ncbi:MAG: ATP-binding cassette domain-containing protein [Gallionella sp.]|jgi:branched-chain amino acid transport system ATP-binding protein|nr:ATP-binding cassette domain-containing protein [Gallionella sp.]